MSYTPTNWQAGDIVTAASMNKIEQGIAGTGTFVVHVTISGNVATLDKTWQEIYNASEQKVVTLIYDEANVGSRHIAFLREINSADFWVTFTNDASFGATTASGYPFYENNAGAEV